MNKQSRISSNIGYCWLVDLSKCLPPRSKERSPFSCLRAQGVFEDVHARIDYSTKYESLCN